MGTYDMRYSSTNYYNITPVDIEKVPRARIFNNKTDEYIQQPCKRILHRSMTRTDGYKNDEVGEIIDLDGNIAMELTGRGGRLVDTLSDQYYDIVVKGKRLSLILIHNHLNNSSVSFNDIHTFLSETSLLGVIAVSNNGCISYVIKTNSDIHYYEKLANKISLIIPKRAPNRKSPSKIRSVMLNNPSKYRLNIGRSNRRV